MSRLLSTLPAVAASLLLSACGPEPKPLSSFTWCELSAGSYLSFKKSGEVDPEHKGVTLSLCSSTPPQDCASISSDVVATLNGQVMESHGSGIVLGGCSVPLFTLDVPNDRYSPEGGNARFVVSDATHTISAEFEGFFVPRPEGHSSLPVLSCEGVMLGCTASSPW
jgi:hypothetical protein